MVAPATLRLRWTGPVGPDGGDKTTPAIHRSPTVKVKACGKDSDGYVMIVATSCGSGVVVWPCATVCALGESYCTYLAAT